MNFQICKDLSESVKLSSDENVYRLQIWGQTRAGIIESYMDEQLATGTTPPFVSDHPKLDTARIACSVVIVGRSQTKTIIV